MYPDRDYYRPGGFGGFSLFPPVIKNLLIINVVVFLIDMFFAELRVGSVALSNIINKYFALMPLNGLRDPFYGEVIASFYPWQLITYQFMHGGFTHLLFNMFTLWMFGTEIENIFGSKKFLFFYLLCGVGGALIHLFYQLAVGTGAPTVGASGSIFGVMIAFAMMFPDRYIFVYFLIPVKAKYLIAFFVVFEFLSTGRPDFVAHLVHLGGAATAFAFIIFERRKSLNFESLFKSFKKSGSEKNQFRRKFSSKSTQVEDADYYEINNYKKKEDEVTQEEIDRILDKISRSGYQNLSEKEKRILFEASKKN